MVFLIKVGEFKEDFSRALRVYTWLSEYVPKLDFYPNGKIENPTLSNVQLISYAIASGNQMIETIFFTERTRVIYYARQKTKKDYVLSFEYSKIEGLVAN